MPISGLEKSSSLRPAARSMARAGARWAPSVRAELRGFNVLSVKATFLLAYRRCYQTLGSSRPNYREDLRDHTSYPKTPKGGQAQRRGRIGAARHSIRQRRYKHGGEQSMSPINRYGASNKPKLCSKHKLTLLAKKMQREMSSF